jgi:hypothetical protein
MRNIETKLARHLTLAVLTVVVLGAGAFATNASAQNASVFEIQVPFEFVVQGRTYAAATYRIGRLSPANPDMLVLKSSTGKTLSIFQTQRLNSGAQAEFSGLTFKRFGETFFLDSVRASGARYDSRLTSTRSDRRRQGVAPPAQILSIVANK